MKKTNERQRPVNIKITPTLKKRILKQVEIYKQKFPGPPVMTMSRYIKEAVLMRLEQDEHFNSF